MKKIRLGRTELLVSKPGFGCLPIQRVDKDTAALILRKAYDKGINYFDSANAYTDSEEKIGYALNDVRHNIIISTKSGAQDKKTVTKHIEESLRRLKTDYIDIFQFHNPPTMPDKNDPDGIFAAALEAKKKGYVRFIGITNHRMQVAKEAIDSRYFDTLQFPFSYISSEEDIELVKACKEEDMGFIAMKGLAGGLLASNPKACHVFMEQFDNVVPIWGIQRETELDQWIQLANEEAVMTEEIKAAIEKDKKELAKSFCRGCGYCMPCPMGIEINNCARMNMLLRRSPSAKYLTKEFYEKMHKIDNCLNCGSCKKKCPYGLDTPSLLKEMLADYDKFYEEHAQK